MLIAQITDTHVIEEGLLLFGRIDTNTMLECAVRAILDHRPAFDAVLVTGDLTNDGTPAQIEAFLRRLAPLSMPVHVIPGNHDDRDVLRAALGLHDMPLAGRLCYAADIGPVRLIALDSLNQGRHDGHLGQEQLDWLDRTLAVSPDAPTLVMIHHPPFTSGIRMMDRSPLIDAEALARVIARHPQVERLLCGHLHRPTQRRFAGTIAMTAPSVAHQVSLDLDPDGALHWVKEPPAMLIHRFDLPGGVIVSHQAYIGDHGPHRPFGGPNLSRAEAADLAQ